MMYIFKYQDIHCLVSKNNEHRDFIHFNVHKTTKPLIDLHIAYPTENYIHRCIYHQNCNILSIRKDVVSEYIFELTNEHKLKYL